MALCRAAVSHLKLLIPKLYFEAKTPVFMPFLYRSTDQPVLLVLSRCWHVSGPLLANQGQSCRYVYALNIHLTNRNQNIYIYITGRPGSSEVPRNPLTRWDVSSIPANGIFLTKKLKNKIKMPNGWKTFKSLVHKIRLHSRRGKGMAESFSREKLRHAPQKEGG